MNTITLPIIAAFFATHVFADEIPKRVQRKLLAAAPEIDLNRDGEITGEELDTGRDELPEDMRSLLDLYMNAQVGNTEEPGPAKHGTTLPKPLKDMAPVLPTSRERTVNGHIEET